MHWRNRRNRFIIIEEFSHNPTLFREFRRIPTILERCGTVNSGLILVNSMCNRVSLSRERQFLSWRSAFNGMQRLHEMQTLVGPCKFNGPSVAPYLPSFLCRYMNEKLLITTLNSLTFIAWQTLHVSIFSSSLDVVLSWMTSLNANIRYVSQVVQSFVVLTWWFSGQGVGGSTALCSHKNQPCFREKSARNEIAQTFLDSTWQG